MKYQKGFNFTPHSELDNIDSEMELDKTYFPPNTDSLKALKEAELIKIKVNTSGLSDLFTQIDSEYDKFKDALTALADAIDDESGKDPAGLMWMFSLKEWRWKIVGWLFELICWIDTD